MALDEPTADDQIFENEGFNLIIEKTLFDQLGGVKIEYQRSPWLGAGFKITPSERVSGGCC